MAVPRALRDALIAAALAEPFEWSRAFVVKRLRTKKDARDAEWLFSLAYEHRRGAKVSALVERVRERSGRAA